MKQRKTALLKSGLAVLLALSMLVGSTFAWFTDSVTSKSNIIKAGKLDVEMYWTDDLDSGVWHNVEEDGKNTIFSYDNWEPGYTDVKYIKLVNNGNLALNYKLTLTPENGVGKLAEVINVYFADEAVEMNGREDLDKLGAIGLLNTVLNGGATANGTLLADGQQSPLHPTKETVMTLAMTMITTAGNEYQEEDAGDFTITALATQAPFEQDAFGANYDGNAEYPQLISGGSVTATFNPDNGKVPAGGVTLQGNGIAAYAPAGVALKNGADQLKLSVTPLQNTTSDITVVNNEILIPVDVHVDGVAEDNTTPIIVDLGEVLPKYLNMGNYHLFHVEDGANSVMTLVDSRDALTAHNTFTYEPYTGAVSVALASFSEVALVADTSAGWEGNYDYSWYTNTKARSTADYTIANADQLAAFGAIVGGMAEGIERDSFAGKTVKLLSDINLGDKEGEGSEVIFHPIGYYYQNGDSTVKSFEGTFDGNGHTIANFYQNTWEIKGDYDGSYYKDAMGLFGYVVNGTVKNLTVDHFSSDGEFTPTGVVAAYAVNSTFENIAITNCEPRVYNTGNGGIVGIGGNSNDPDTYKLTFNNITIDNTNKITALWGSWDVACGGLVGMFRGAGHVYMNNCHVAAQMDVYNDVCGNYQYYWYRYSGMMVGTNKNMVTDKDGYTVPETSKFYAENCTVHFGDWNDYYYCELVANTLASYTHDHQMSRLDEVDAVDVEKMTYTVGEATQNIPTKGRYNYVVLTGGYETENAECYHFVDGVQWKHEQAGKETVNGKEILVEDKQHIYLPFNQLFTGYGWGVKHIPVGEFSGVEILPRENAKSDVKFAEKGAAGKAFETESTVYIGDLFEEKLEDDENAIVSDRVRVFVSPVGDGSTVSGVYNADAAAWENGTLTFAGLGAAEITITDYYFCKPTKIYVNITEIQDVEKFKPKFNNDDFLYRVGNGNTVAIGSLFDSTGKKAINSATVDVTVTKVNDASNVMGAFTANTSDWTKGTLKFEGTGIAKITIQDDNYCTPTVLYVEVVDAVNVAENGKIDNYNTTSVLLGNTTLSTLYLNDGATLYGNGFTIDCTNAPINGTGNVSGNYVIGLAGANLDNVKIVGKVYTEYGAMASNDYNRALVVSTGNSTITNCYLSNTAAPIRINGGSLLVKGSTLKGGNFANVDIRSGHLTLDNVTTINQALGNDKAEKGETVIGLGIVVYYENVNISATSITVKNGLTQYNHISSDDEFSNTYANQFVSGMFNSANSVLQYSKGSTKWVNSGIILMTGGINVTGVGEKTDVSFMGATGAVYTAVPTAESIVKTPAEYTTFGQGLIAPSALLNHDNAEKGNYIPKETGKNDYCYFDGQKVLISMDQGDTFQYDPFILNAIKLGHTLNYTVKVNGNDVSNGSKISFDTPGDYTITYTYEDPYNYRVSSNGVLETFTETYTKTDVVTVATVEPEAEHAKFTFEKGSTATEEILYNNNTYISAKGVTADGTTWGKITVGGKTIVYPIVTANVNRNTTNKECQVFYYVFKNVISITDANGTTYSHANNTGTDGKMPSNLKVIKGNELKVENQVFTNYNDANLSRTAGKIFCYSSSGQEDAPVVFNGALAYKSPSGLGYSSSTRNYDAAVIVQYQFTDSNNATYYYYVGYKISNPNNGKSGDGEDTTCITPDTLITLADGSQVRVDELKGNEELLVWNLETGKYEAAPIVFVDTEEEKAYEIVHLYFSDGSDVKVIGEHGFFDLDLGKYVYIDAENYANYIGHRFVAEGDIAANEWNVITLDNAVVETEVTTAWSPVTFEHLCYYTNGVLSMPGGIEGLFNIFEVNTDTMAYDAEQMQKDIETYGLFTLEDFGGLIPEIAFEAFNGDWLKVAIGKGLLTWEDIAYMAERYIPLM